MPGREGSSKEKFPESDVFALAEEMAERRVKFFEFVEEGFVGYAEVPAWGWMLVGRVVDFRCRIE